MGRMGGGELWILGTRTHNDGHACIDKFGNSLLPLGVSKKRPVTHGATVDNRRHAELDHFEPFGNQGIEIRFTVSVARCHEGWNNASVNI